MNIFRWRRKSKNKIRPKTFILFIFLLIMTTFAWFAYSKVLDTSLNIHVASWDIEYYEDSISEENKVENPIEVGIGTLYPAMTEQTKTILIKNNGETIVDIDYYVESVTIAGETYTLVQEGGTIPEGNYIVLTSTYVETDATTGNEIVRGTITNDITKFPFTIEIEHSAQVAAQGQGYLTVTANWSGDNDELDSEWGYKVGEYLTANPTANAILINLNVDSYQAPDTPVQETINMPSTSETSPYLPTNFVRVAGTTLSTGLVIKDALGNEYVWIEVPKNTTVYANSGLNITDFSDTTSIENDLKAYSSAYRVVVDTYDTTNSSRALGIDQTEYTELKNKMLKSIYQNGGFYIGRYETGILESYRTNYVTTIDENPVIQANAYPYNFVSCEQAQRLASSMSSGSHTSSLMFGLQWDLVLKYLETKGTAQSALKTSSTDWGNYYNSKYNILNTKSKYSTNATTWTEVASLYQKTTPSATVLTTGANSLFSKQNIFDLAGNLAEWTFNIDYTASTGGVGGDYLDTTATGANNFGSYTATTGVKQVGFRVTIY